MTEKFYLVVLTADELATLFAVAHETGFDLESALRRTDGLVKGEPQG